MKTKLPHARIRLFLLFLALSPVPFALSQIPQGFNYQAIARDGSGAILANTALPVKIAIQTSTGTVIYEELFSSVVTNQFGLISLVVGTGAWQSGSAPSFSAIDWKIQPLYLKTTIRYPGLTWTVMGTSQMWSVPYSLLAKDVQGPLSKLGISGTTDVMDEALFEVKNKAGKVVFAVYNEGIRAYVGNGSAKGVKGGFSVGGYDATKSDTIRDIFVLSTDSARIYLDSKPQNGTKGVKGGFSVGGYDMTKGGTSIQNYIDVTPATTKIFTTDAEKGFAVGNVSTGKAENYLKLNPLNYFIGHESGKNNINGQYNSFLGYQTGVSNTSGSSNSFLGYQTGYKNTEGTGNLLLGYQSGYSNTTGNYNSFVGYLSGNKNTSGLENTFAGSFAGNNNLTGSNNTFLGFNTGLNNSSGSSNSFIGTSSGYSNLTGNHNVFIGTESGFSNTIGSFNSFMGYHTGHSNIKGRYNVFLGYEAGFSNDSSFNTILGYQAGRSTLTGSENFYAGYQSGYKNISGYQNTLIGSMAGFENVDGYQNVFLGGNAGRENKSSQNVFLGASAGQMSSTGSSVLIGTCAGYQSDWRFNVFIGMFTGAYTSGKDNVFIGGYSGTESDGNENLYAGFQAGKFIRGDYNICLGFGAGARGWETLIESPSNSNIFIGKNAGSAYKMGDDNILIGSNAGIMTRGANNVIIGGSAGEIAGSNNIIIGYYAAATKWANNRLYVDISDHDSADTFIWGNMDARILALNANVGIGTPTPAYKLQVGKAGDGTQARANAWNLLSDMRYKTDIEALSDPIEKIIGINGFYFHWNTGTDKSRQFGLSAQDVEKVLPEVVSKGIDGYLSVDYGKMVPLLIEGMKEQQHQIESQKKENQDLKAELNSITDRLEKLEATMTGKK